MPSNVKALVVRQAAVVDMKIDDPVPKITLQIEEELQAINRLRRTALEHVKRVGELLAEAKRRIPHGQWLPWLHHHCDDMSDTTAQGYMRVAEHWDALRSKTDRVADLPLRQALVFLRGRAAIPQGGDDRVMTPQSLAVDVVKHFKPRGTMLEPCAGSGAFTEALRGPGRRVYTCEITRSTYRRQNPARDFFKWKRSVDWIITNPPWSQFQPFLRHAMTLAPNVVFVAPVVHWWTKRRVRDVRAAGFGYKRLVLIEGHPEGWPQTGFQLGAMYVARGYTGALQIETLVSPSLAKQ